MKSRPTIFISGVSHEFGLFRDAVENEVQMKGCFPENQPGFPPDYREVEEMLRRKIDEADAVICLIGFRFGAEPANRPDDVPRRSYTQMEFDIARELGKPVYLFLSADEKVRDKPRTKLEPQDAEATELQLKHREAVQGANHLWYLFKDKQELRNLVAEIPIVAAADFRVDVQRILKYTPEYLIGREEDSALLDAAWDQVRRPGGESGSPDVNVLTFVALGGEGKTSLVAKWVAKLAGEHWPGCDAALAWSFYSQGTRDRGDASADVFLAFALRFFGDEAMADSAASAWDKGKRLAELVSERRTLLILDGLEPLQYSPTSPSRGELKEEGLIALLSSLAVKNAGLCVVTTRYEIPNLNNYRETTAPQHKLPQLSVPAGVNLLHQLGVRKNSGTQQEFEALVEEVKGHALTINLLGKFLVDAHAGDIRKRDLVRFEDADSEEQGGHAFRVMDAYVKWFEDEGEKGRQAMGLLRLMGLFDRAATADCIAALKQSPVIDGLTDPLVGLGEAKRNIALKRLAEANLLDVDRDASGALLSLDCHPLIREYFAKRLQEDQPEAWRAGHQRLFEHLCETTNEGEEPTLEQLQPLYQAVSHGCLAGLQKQSRELVYCDRILKGTGPDDFYSVNKLGALGADLGALSCFFGGDWRNVSTAFTALDQSWLFGEVSYRLKALGRLHEALEPMRAGLEMGVNQRNWNLAAPVAGNLSELLLTMGDVNAAVDVARQSVNYADRSREEFVRMGNRTTLADALHQSGQSKEAASLFAETEQIQADTQPTYPMLYAVRGFRYCDLLLSAWERIAWQSITLALGRPDSISAGAMLDEIEQRGTRMFAWRSSYDSLLDIAVEHLTLARVALYRSRLEQRPLPDPDEPTSHIALAVRGLRDAGQQDFLPRGLLSMAWYQHEHGNDAAARETLDEAEQIAARGPMPLHLADIHLYRARLFHDKKELTLAEDLINKHHYERRRNELNDAKNAVK